MSKTVGPTLSIVRLLIASVSIFLAGCEDFSSSHPSALHVAGPSQDFAEWCREWKVDCATRRLSNQADGSFDEGMRKSFSAIFLEFLQSSSKFSVSRSDLDASDLRQGLKVLGIDAVLSPLAQRLDGVGWQSASLVESTLQLQSQQGGWLATQSGLQLELSALSSFRFPSQDRIEAEGVSLRTLSNDQTPKLFALQYHPGEALTIELSDRTVKNVPAWFMAQTIFEAFGLDEAGLFEQDSVSGVQTIEGLFPLFNWLNQPSRVLSLSQGFFKKVAMELAALPEMDPALVTIIKALASLQSSSQLNHNVLSLGQIQGGSLRCASDNGALVLSLEKSFGVKRFYKAGSDGIGLEFFGLRASSEKIFGSLSVKRIEITPESFSILDIPIISKFKLKWKDLENQTGQKAATICTF